jgi:hypothetical protein
MVGHRFELTLQCNECGTTKEWNGSSAYSDGSLVVNKDIIRAWHIIGGERSHYFEFTQAFRYRQYNYSSFDNIVHLMKPIILKAEDKMLRANIGAINTMKEGYLLGFDC